MPAHNEWNSLRWVRHRRECMNEPAVSAAWCLVAARSLMKAFSAAALPSGVEVYARRGALRRRREAGWFARREARKSIARAAVGIIVGAIVSGDGKCCEG